MRKEQKIELVNSITAEIKESAGVIITNYKGLTFDQMDEIRRSFKEAGNDYRVIKNTLLKKALNADNITEIDYTLVEPTALVVVKEDFAAAAKLAKKYAKDAAMSKFFAIKGGYFDGMALDQSGIEKLADLPSRACGAVVVLYFGGCAFFVWGCPYYFLFKNPVVRRRFAPWHRNCRFWYFYSSFSHVCFGHFVRLFGTDYSCKRLCQSAKSLHFEAVQL